MIPASDIWAHLQGLAVNRDPFLSSSHYFFARSYIKSEMMRYGSMEVQSASTPYGDLENIILTLPSEASGSSIIIGAHYDTVPGSPGADDNASGVAVLLALAKALSDRPLPRPIRLIAFDLEEYGLLGSQAYVEALRQSNETIRIMMSLEMLGYVDDTPGSQTYPPGLQWIYPDQGNFIGLIGNPSSLPMMFQMQKSCKQAGAPCQILPVPGRGKMLPMTRLSDHAPFWDAGYPAVMVTDTAFLRNPHYHQPSDTLDTLNVEFMAAVANGILAAIAPTP